MKPFAFLKETPDWAKANDCGQYNGYIALPAILYEQIAYDDDGYVAHRLPIKVFGRWCEVTFSEPKMTFEKLGGVIPVTAIPEEAANGEPFCVFGYDTCHACNSWAENDYANEAKVTREWLRLAVEMWIE